MKTIMRASRKTLPVAMFIVTDKFHGTSLLNDQESIAGGAQ